MSSRRHPRSVASTTRVHNGCIGIDMYYMCTFLNISKSIPYAHSTPLTPHAGDVDGGICAFPLILIMPGGTLVIGGLSLLTYLAHVYI